MEFGIFLRSAVTYTKMLEVARQAEQLGFMGGFLNDHVHGFANEGKEDYLEAFTAMTGIGVQTTKLRVGQIVLFNSLRNPAFLAKSAATLDQMTNGRYELLIGAGWNEPEYKGYDLMERGRGMPSAGERVSRFKEALQILKLMLHNEVVDFDGEYWKLDGAINMPLPVQNPLRISVGCSKPRMMNITAKYADGINISARSIPDIKEGTAEFSKIAMAYDKSLQDYYVSGFGGIQLAETDEQAQDLAKSYAKRVNKPVDEVLSDYLVGKTEDVLGKLQVLKDTGLDMIVTAITLHEDMTSDPLDYFHDNIMKNVS